jgi:hypothetical protein
MREVKVRRKVPEGTAVAASCDTVTNAVPDFVSEPADAEPGFRHDALHEQVQRREIAEDFHANSRRASAEATKGEQGKAIDPGKKELPGITSSSPPPNHSTVGEGRADNAGVHPPHVGGVGAKFFPHDLFELKK